MSANVRSRSILRIPACLSFLLICVAIGYAQAPAGANRPISVPEGYVITPFGYFHPSCVRHLASGDNLSADGLVIQHTSGKISHAAACEYPRYTPNGEVVFPGSRILPPTISHSWIVDGETNNATSYGEVTASWTVPSAPTTNNGQTIYFFPGLQDTNLDETILQPVLGWNADFSAAWGVASWNCCPSGTANESTPLNASSGDQIFGEVQSTCAAGTLTCSKWNVISQKTNVLGNIATTTLSNTPNEGQTFNWAFGGALEVYNVSQCSNYPPNSALTFGSTLYNNSFQIISPGYSAVNRAVGLTPQCNYSAQISGGTVSVVFGSGASLSPTGVNFGTWDISHPPVSRAFTLTNFGSTSINITSVVVLSDPFSLGSKTCGATLAGGASCSITVTLTPGNAGGAETVTGTLTVTDSASNSPQKSSFTAKITCTHGC